MKKFLTLILLTTLFVDYSFAQQTRDNRSSDSEIKIQENAEIWFKDVYVEEIFNDPYSYKHLKTITTPKTIEDFLNKKLSDINNQLDNDKSGYGYEMVNPETRQSSEDFYNQSLSEIAALTKSIEIDPDATKSKYNNKRIDVYKKYGKEALDLMERIDIHNLNVEQRNFTLDQLKNLSIDEKKEIAYYEVRIDCYYKNKMGNEILGRFSFPFNVNGLVGGLDAVDHINK